MSNGSKEKFIDNFFAKIHFLGDEDGRVLFQKEKSYGGSWKKRGGIGAFMMLARKWDRIEQQVQEHGYDVFKAIQNDSADEGILDDIRDLRRYLFLVDAEMALTKEDNIDEETE